MVPVFLLIITDVISIWKQAKIRIDIGHLFSSAYINIFDLK